MRVAILQPSYIPWPGYFYWLLNCDCFVYLDDVQYTKEDWRNRNRIRTAAGTQWLTVPVLTKARFGQHIGQVHINNQVRWTDKHWKSLCQNYRRAAHFDTYADFFQGIYARPWELLADLTIHLMSAIAGLLGPTPEFRRASEFETSGEKTRRLVEICRYLGATEYISGAGARNYIDAREFEAHNIDIRYLDYQPRPYPQQTLDFVPYLSIVDLMFNCGPESWEFVR